ncbi:MAG: adenylate/guanylate cyclase domain-containing protein [Candidatus Hydrogenedentota bacterium]|nr:MAG: adenylate/guanylate cyclase domain-containing protein [Candidatus Hydrogenedentota bacterium]
MNFIVMGFYFIGSLVTDYPRAYLYLLIVAGFAFISIFLSRPYVKPSIFKTAFYGSILLVLVFASLFAGSKANIHLILSASILAPFVTLQKSEKTLLVLGVAMNILFTIVLVVAFNFMDPLFPLNGFALYLTQTAMFSFYLIPVLGFGHFVWKETHLLEEYLENEKNKSDLLLKSILPETIAEELKNTGHSEPRYYDQATVLFTDFVGFTKVSANLTPQKLVGELDLCFSYFDSVMKKYGLEKLKTIGDAYMAVAGIPIEKKTHAIDAVMAALEIREIMRYMKEFRKAEEDFFWEIRIGLHSGPLVAGIIGEEKFAYDVWGDTVNTASRMESAGKADSINISKETYELIKDFFQCEYRGKIAVKNIGKLEMYFVHGLKEQYSHTHTVLSPNERFLQEYKKLCLPKNTSTKNDL